MNEMDDKSRRSSESHHICVNCGERIGPLFIEYSEKNFRLTHCPSCLRIADKYIEFELLLVLIDILLHEDAAYYHLLYNRYSTTISQRAKRWLPIMVIIITILVRLIVFRETIYKEYTVAALIHVTMASICDILSYLIVMGSCWNYWNFWMPANNQSIAPLSSNGFLQFYFALLFPEIFKISIIILYIFDSTSNLLFLLNSIIVALQYTAIKCVTRIESPLWLHPAPSSNNSTNSNPTPDSVDLIPDQREKNRSLYRRLFASFVVSIVIRIVVNRCFHSTGEILVLGGILV